MLSGGSNRIFPAGNNANTQIMLYKMDYDAAYLINDERALLV